MLGWLLHYRQRNQKQSIIMPGKCKENGCKKWAIFGYPAEKTGTKFMITRCGSHRLEGMILFNSICNFKGCQVVASFGYQHIPQRIRCFGHKSPGMVIKNRGHKAKGTQPKEKKTLRRKRKPNSVSPSSCSSSSSVSSNSSESVVSRSTKIGKIWQINEGTIFFLPFHANI